MVIVRVTLDRQTRWIVEHGFADERKALDLADDLNLAWLVEGIFAAVVGLPRKPWKPGRLLWSPRLRRWVRFRRWQGHWALCRVIGRDVPDFDREQAFRRDELRDKPRSRRVAQQPAHL